MAQKSNPEKQNNVGVQDDIGKEMIEATRDKILKELEMFQNKLPEQQKGKERFVKMWERDKRMYELMLEGDNHKKIEPQWNYEKSEEYWDIRKSQLQDKYEQDKFVSERKIEEYDASIEAIQEEIESCKKQLAELDEGDTDE